MVRWTHSDRGAWRLECLLPAFHHDSCSIWQQFPSQGPGAFPGKGEEVAIEMRLIGIPAGCCEFCKRCRPARLKLRDGAFEAHDPRDRLRWHPDVTADTWEEMLA